MKRKALIIPALMILSAISCVREEIPADKGTMPAGTADITLNLNIDDGHEVYVYTKADEDPSSGNNTQIRNLCIFQFNGTDENAPVVGEARYISDDADPTDEEKYLDFNKIRLADSQGEVHTLVILANTFKKLPQVSTLGEMKALVRTVDKEEDLFGYEGQWTRMNMITSTIVKNGTIVTGTLRKSMARINIHIENNDVTDGLVISGIQLCNVSRNDHYLTNYDGFIDIFNPLVPDRTDYPIAQWTGNPDGTGSADYSFHITANQRGGCEGATYLKIYGFYGPEHDIPIEYDYYIGEDDNGNFNIRPNSINYVSIVYNKAGNAEVDDRITLVTKDFDVSANCYILNPHPTYSRSYTFNVVRRINDFWGSRFGLNDDSVIEESEEWNARVLWSDTKFTSDQINNLLERKSGNGSGDYMSDSQRIRIILPPGMTHSNIIIGVYTDDPEKILWSWHLWITDYQPDDILGHVPEQDRYLYAVKGGEVHRYAGPAWKENGKYENGYVMDRNLGCFDNKHHGSEKGQGMFYQFGRKDPFPGGFKGYKYDTGNSYTNPKSTTYVAMDDNTLAGYGGANVPYTVNNPLVYIYGGSYGWTYGDIFTSENNNIWNDPYRFKNSGNDETGGTADKSFFDPCPPGWELPSGSNNPSQHWVSDFVLTKSDGSGAKGNCIQIASYLVYYPKGYPDNDGSSVTQAIRFPMFGHLTGQGGITWNNLIFYLATEMGKKGSNTFYTFCGSNNSGTITPRYATGNLGVNVRCIREDY